MSASSSQAIYSTDLNDLYPKNFETVCDNPFKYPCLQSEESDISSHFKPDYKIIGDKIIELPYVITSEIETISSLIDLGNILLNDSRNATPDELTAMNRYIKKKYKKIKK